MNRISDLDPVHEEVEKQKEMLLRLNYSRYARLSYLLEHYDKKARAGREKIEFRTKLIDRYFREQQRIKKALSNKFSTE